MKPACLLPLGLLLANTAAPVAIRIGGEGYAPADPKIATVETDALRPLPWQVRDKAGHVVLAGRTVPLGRDAAAGRATHGIDFTALGRGVGYRLTVAGGASASFDVGDHPGRRLARDAAAYFYHNRAGVPIEARFVGARWARPAGHPRERATCFKGLDQRGTMWRGCGYTLDVTGGWYDAGDHGKYVVNGGIAAWTLLNLVEWAEATRRRSPFEDGALAIPEAGNGVDDLLDEARVEVEWMLRMQVPAGTMLDLPVGEQPATGPYRLRAVDASGMAHHKVADANWTALPMRPDRDPEPRLLYPPGTAATLNLAAVAAQAARVWRTRDPAFADRCLQAARTALAAARRNPAVYAAEAFAGSGGYGDRDLSDEWFWALAELHATTGDAGLLSELKALPAFASPVTDPNWGAVAPLGFVTMAIADDFLSPRDRTAVRMQIVGAADRFRAESVRSGYGIPYAGTAFAWGSNSMLLNRAILLALAADWTGQPGYRVPVIATLDYLTGRNPLGRSFVAGHGTHPLSHPHHRYWAQGINPTYPPAPPGALSGGPNSSGRGDDVAKALGPCAPMTCWRDDARAYSLNEVAINWNAPLVWVAAWRDATEQ